jgi:hypothetical protein
VRRLLLACVAVALTAPAAASADPVIYAAGDIACSPGSVTTATQCAQKRTSDLISSSSRVLPLGDNQYDTGALSAYTSVYRPTWGRFDPLASPVPGNHDYGTSGAGGYFSYFGARAGTRGQGWYSYDLGAWHLLALNSECSHLGGSPCASGGAQETFVRTDLASHPNACTLAYFHEPVFSSGSDTVENAAAMKPIWRDLYAAHVDLVLNGHKHNYQRANLLGPTGAVDSRGIRLIIVGTGGENHSGTAALRSGFQVFDNKTFGVLKVTLHAASYDWRFLPEPGKSFTDSGTDRCR